MPVARPRQADPDGSDGPDRLTDLPPCQQPVLRVAIDAVEVLLVFSPSLARILRMSESSSAFLAGHGVFLNNFQS